MHRRHLQDALRYYFDLWVPGLLPYQGFDAAEEADVLQRLRDFSERRADCLDRSCSEGHITSSALITNPSMDKVLLTLHAKLGIWIQLGGHVDGEEDIAASALREAREESGRPEVQLVDWTHALKLLPETARVPVPFDCDIHVIPARKMDPEHEHFDVRYLCILDDSLDLVISEESKDLRWLPLEEAKELTKEPSMQRQFAKLEAFAERSRNLVRANDQGLFHSSHVL